MHVLDGFQKFKEIVLLFYGKRRQLNSYVIDSFLLFCMFVV